MIKKLVLIFFASWFSIFALSMTAVSIHKKITKKYELIEAVDKFCRQYDIDSSVILAIIWTETGGFRFTEPRNDRRVLMSQKWFTDMLSDPYYKLDKNDPLTYSSIGVCQVLFASARAKGFQGTTSEFVRGGYHTNLKYACMILADFRIACMPSGNKWDAVACYNAGKTRWEWNPKTKKYQYLNHKYVDMVKFAYTNKYGGDLNE